MWDLSTYILIASVFLLGGFFKGVVGLGLPVTVLAILTTFIGLKPTVALTIVPVLATNVWQAVAGGEFWAILRRTWSLILLLAAATWVGAGLLASTDATLLGGVLGTLLALYSAYSLTRPQISTPGRNEGWMSPVVGLLSGLTNGMTGTIIVPGVIYLQALGLPRDAFVQMLGVVFVTSGLSLGVSLAGHGLLPAELGVLSAAALVPAGIGMWVGQTVRKRLPEERFRKVFFAVLLLIGLNLIVRVLFA